MKAIITFSTLDCCRPGLITRAMAQIRNRALPTCMPVISPTLKGASMRPRKRMEPITAELWDAPSRAAGVVLDFTNKR